jgi:hypothetical protein
VWGIVFCSFSAIGVIVTSLHSCELTASHRYQVDVVDFLIQQEGKYFFSVIQFHSFFIIF